MASTEIRIRIEDALSASHFGDEFPRLSARSVRLHSFPKVTHHFSRFRVEPVRRSVDPLQVMCLDFRPRS